MTKLQEQTRNALTLLRSFTSPRADYSDETVFDHKAFIGEMQARCVQAYARPLSKSELRNLGKLVRVYCEQYKVARDLGETTGGLDT